MRLTEFVHRRRSAMRMAISIVGMLFLTLLVTSNVFAYPSAERRPTGISSPPLDLNLQTATGLAIDNANYQLYVSYGQTFRIVDLTTFALSSTTPYDISSDSNLSGSLKGFAINSTDNLVYATQEGGYLVSYNRADLSAKPTRVSLASGKTLTFIDFDSTARVIYMYNETDRSVITVNANTLVVTGSIALNTGITSLTVNGMRFVPNVTSTQGALYLTTSNGRVLVIPSGVPAASTITIDTNGTDVLKGLAALPNSSAIFVINATKKQIHKILTTTNAVTDTYTFSANSDITDVQIADVTNPTATYGFAIGSNGLSIFNTDTGEIFDLGSTDTASEPLSISGNGPMAISNDGYLFVSYGKIAIISDNPFVTETGTSYSSGSSLGTSGTVSLTFQSDEAGTYEMRVGGTPANQGTLLQDSTGATSGAIAANTSTSVTIPYSANSSVWSEGTNTVFIFVTDSAGNVGRIATTVTVDTPPPDVTLNSVGFGTERLYLNVSRIDKTDIASYRAYVDTDPAAVLTKSTIAGSAGQTSSGTDPVIIAADLSNNVTYYVAVDAIDNGGNTSASRTRLLTSGAVASGSPEITAGPAGLAGEHGCTLIVDDE